VIPGDIHFIVKIQPHRRFERSGDHLKIQETINLYEVCFRDLHFQIALLLFCLLTRL
jgi:DnaJ-related protein SCJ1